MKNKTLLLFLLLFWVGGASAQNKSSKESFSFVFVSDMHIQPERNVPKSVTKALDLINKLSPDFVINGGDLIFDSNQANEQRTDSLYDLYKQTVSQLKMPLYNVIGNHDLFGYYLANGIKPEHPMFGKKKFEKTIGPRYQTRIINGWRFFMLDDIDDLAPKTIKGSMDLDQLAWIKAVLDSTDKQTPIAIALHIPLITTFTLMERGPTASTSEGMVYSNAKYLLDLFKGYNLKLVLQGHTHSYETIFVQNILFVTGGSLSGWKWNGPNRGTSPGFVLLKIKGGQITPEYIDYGWKPQAK
jgi:3',5'-cyclic AMP phosphodiesterase CpdA